MSRFSNGRVTVEISGDIDVTAVCVNGKTVFSNNEDEDYDFDDASYSCSDIHDDGWDDWEDETESHYEEEEAERREQEEILWAAVGELL